MTQHKHYVEASFTLSPAAVATAIEEQDFEGAAVIFGDDGGVTVSVSVDHSNTLAYAMSSGVVIAKAALVAATALQGRADAIGEPWRVLVVSSELMTAHYQASAGERPKEGPGELVQA